MADFPEVFQRELEVIGRRRGDADLERYTIRQAGQLNLVGLALSGGGIRSATFNLGLLQAIGGPFGILPACDYLSTVSGGGYIGACLSSLAAGAPVDLSPERFPLAAGAERERLEVRHLREHSQYLAPRPGVLRLDTWRLVAAYLGGLLFTLSTGAAILGLFAAAGIVVYPVILHLVEGLVGRPLSEGDALWASPQDHLPSLFMPAAIALALWAVSAVAYAVATWTGRTWSIGVRGWLTKAQGWCLRAAALTAAFGAVPLLLVWVDGQLGRLAPALTLTALLSALTVPRAFALSAQVKQVWDRVKKWALGLGVWVFVGLVCLAVLYAVWTLRALALPISLGLALYLWLLSRLIDANRVSMYYFYRDRLSEAFVFRREGEALVSNDRLPLHAMAFEDRRVPYHLINTTVNLPASEDLTLRRRQGDLFLLSPLYCGSRVTGYRATADYERGRVSLASAMALSGAAANPQHGYGTSPALAFLMTLLNVRLGVWAEHPEYKAGILRGLGRPRTFWPYYLFLELFSRADEHGNLLSLSDGGHIENLGAYELLRRHCRTVIVSDATADPKCSFGDLARLMRLARIDLGVDLYLKAEPLIPNPDSGRSAAHVVAGEVLYPGTTGPAEAPEPDVGTVYYVKASLTESDPRDLQQYRSANPTFPHETTADQFFDEAQFESYRRLGFESGRALLALIHRRDAVPLRA